MESIIINNNSSEINPIEEKYIEYLETLRGYYESVYDIGRVELIVSEQRDYAALKLASIIAFVKRDSKKYYELSILELDQYSNTTVANYHLSSTSTLSKKIGKHFKNHLEENLGLEKLC